MKKRFNLILRSVLVTAMLAGFLMLPADTASANGWDQCHWACSNICVQRCQYSPAAACHSTCMDSCVPLFCANPLPV